MEIYTKVSDIVKKIHKHVCYIFHVINGENMRKLFKLVLAGAICFSMVGYMKIIDFLVDTLQN